MQYEYQNEDARVNVSIRSRPEGREMHKNTTERVRGISRPEGREMPFTSWEVHDKDHRFNPLPARGPGDAIVGGAMLAKGFVSIRSRPEGREMRYDQRRHVG